MSLERVPELYYTAAQARAVLGLNEHTFQTWIKTGRILRTKLPGMGHGLYLRREIDRIAYTIEAAMALEGAKDLEYKMATPSEVKAEIHLAHLLYGKHVLLPEAQRARHRLIEINPEATWYLYDKEMLAASINIVPLIPTAIEAFKQGKRGWLFGTESIRQFVLGEPLECIIIDYMSTPAVPPEKRSFYSWVLLRDFAVVTLKLWGARGVEIRKIYACGSTQYGRRLLSHSGFVKLGEPIPGRVIFELDIEAAHPNIKLLRPYKEALAAYKDSQH